MPNKVPEVYVIFTNTPSPSAVVFEGNVGKKWFWCRTVFTEDWRNIEKVEFIPMGEAYEVLGEPISHFVKQDENETDAKAMRGVTKAISAFAEEVLPHLAEALDIVKLGLFPLDEAEAAIAG